MLRLHSPVHTQARSLSQGAKQDPAASEAWDLKPASDVDALEEPAPAAADRLELTAGPELLAPAPGPALPMGPAAGGESSEQTAPAPCAPQYDACLAGCDPDGTQVRCRPQEYIYIIYIYTHILMVINFFFVKNQNHVHCNTRSLTTPALATNHLAQCTAPYSADGSHRWTDCCAGCAAAFDACVATAGGGAA